MEFVNFSKSRFDAALSQIDQLKQSEFPYPHARSVLETLQSLFQAQRTALDAISPSSTPTIAKHLCSVSLSYLFRYTPKLGFVLRSTNVRNAFEIYAPLLRIAQKLLGPDTKLVLSSEWKYSPHIYLPTAELKDVALIGVPAFESSNPLLVPLAGHELGHNVWGNENLVSSFEADLKAHLLDGIRKIKWADFNAYCPIATHTNLESDLFVQQAWVPALTFAKRQLEEVFCDMVGLRIFGQSYMLAFAYLVAPGLLARDRNPIPKLKNVLSF